MSSRTYSRFGGTVASGGATGEFKGLYIGTGGHVHITDAAGTSTIFRSVPTGTFMDVAGNRVGSTLEATAPAAVAIVKLD
jgi:hypothetical protein